MRSYPAKDEPKTHRGTAGEERADEASLPRMAPARKRPSGLARWSRADAALAALLLAIAVFQFATVEGWHDWSGDPAHYVLHAKNIATGQPYAETGYIQSRGFFLAPEAYPPGLPLLLAPVYAGFGVNFYLMEALIAALFLASIVVTVRMLRDDLPRWQLAALAALLGFSPPLWKLSHEVISDVPFFLWASLSLWSIRQMHTAERRRLAWAVGAGLFVYAATITRPLGPVLILSAVLLDLLRARRITWQTGVLLGACVFCYGAHQLVAYAAVAGEALAVGGGEALGGVPGGALPARGYGRLIQQDLLNLLWRLPITLMETTTDYLRRTLTFWHNGYTPWITRLLAALSLLAAAVGWGKRAWQRLSVLEVFFVLYIAALLPWTFSATRYLLPVIPLYFFYMLVGAGQLRQWMGQRLPLRRPAAQRAWLEGAVVAAALVSYGAHYTALPPRAASTDPTEPAAQRFFEHVRLHTSPDAVFIFRKPRILALYTGRAAATYRDARNKPDDDAGMLRHFDRVGARYVVAGPPDETPVLQDLARRHPERLTLVHRDGHFKMYRFKPGS